MKPSVKSPHFRTKGKQKPGYVVHGRVGKYEFHSFPKIPSTEMMTVLRSDLCRYFLRPAVVPLTQLDAALDEILKSRRVDGHKSDHHVANDKE